MSKGLFPDSPIAAILRKAGLDSKGRRPHKQAQQSGGAGSKSGPSVFGHAYNMIMSATGTQQAMLKIVSTHRVHTAAVLRDRMDYLSRDMSDEIAEKYNTDNEQSVELEGSIFMGEDHALSSEAKDNLAERWGDQWHGEKAKHQRFGHTYHMVLSTPPGTDPAKTKAIGRDFAEAILDSGDYGDRWDYVLALHTDTASPHVHLMINRHGIDNGRLLDTYKRTALNVDYLRQMNVAVADKYGIKLAATSRLSRGVSDIAPTTEEYRKAIKNGKIPTGRSHTKQTLAYAELLTKQHAKEYADLAKAYSKPSEANVRALLESAADTLNRGKALAYPGKILTPDAFERVTEARQVVKDWFVRNEKIGFPKLPGRAGKLQYMTTEGGTTLPSNYVTALYASEAKILKVPAKDLLHRLENRALPEELVKALQTIKKDSFIMSNNTVTPEEIGTLEKARAALLKQAAQNDFGIAKVPDQAQRVELELKQAKGKEFLAKLSPERHDLAAFAYESRFRLHNSPALQAMQRSPDQEKMAEVLKPVNDILGKEAEKLGLNKERFLAKYNSTGKLDAGTAAAWVGEELQQRLKHQKIDPQKATNGQLAVADKDVYSLHQKALEAYAKAAKEVRIEIAPLTNEKPKVDIVKAAHIFQDLAQDIGNRGDEAEPSVKASQHDFIRAVEKIVPTDDLKAIRAGDSEVLKRAVPDKTDRLTVMKAYFATSHSLASDDDKPALKAQTTKVAIEMVDEEIKAQQKGPKPERKAGPRMG